MGSETEDAAARRFNIFEPVVALNSKHYIESYSSLNDRCSGLIVGVSDTDPVRWPGSKWRCLLVWICRRACYLSYVWAFFF